MARNAEKQKEGVGEQEEQSRVGGRGEVGHGTRAKVRLEAASAADCAKIKETED